MGPLSEHTRASELRATERQRLAALCAADIQVCDELHAVDYQLITPGGGLLSKEDYLGQIASGELSYRRFEPEGEIAVKVLGSTGIALRYVVVIDVAFPGGEEAGRYWHTDIYESRDGRWQAVWSQATRIRG